eukprot:GDKJ01026490.1.p1 GENE.GDKJ01026490.1~~GDKJ01026490.1.p1  ORF type:complete len:519 (-),score=117.83 GDKJ01026490.1:41-1414(-)
MKPVLKRFNSVVLTSATLSPLTLYPKLLGFSPTVVKSLEMSLDRECILPLVVSRGADQSAISSRFDQRNDGSVVRNYGSLLLGLAQSVPDGVVVFFTSYAYMDAVVAKWYTMGVLAELNKHKLLFIESQDVVATTLALNNYRRACDSGRGAVFFSVARGKVSEGIDFDRHYGRAVLLLGVPFQYVLSKPLKARLDYLKRKHNIEEQAFLSFDAMRQAAQCIGRVIRSKADYGLMILADQRYGRIDKLDKLPQWVRGRIGPTQLNLTSDRAVMQAKVFLKEMSQPYQIGRATRLDKIALDEKELAWRLKKGGESAAAELLAERSAREEAVERDKRRLECLREESLKRQKEEEDGRVNLKMEQMVRVRTDRLNNDAFNALKGENGRQESKATVTVKPEPTTDGMRQVEVHYSSSFQIGMTISTSENTSGNQNVADAVNANQNAPTANTNYIVKPERRDW